MTHPTADVLQVMSRKSPLHLSEMRATFRDGGLVGLGRELDALLDFERDNAAATLALGGKMSYANAQWFVADALEAWREHTAQLRDEANDVARAALGDDAPAMPGPVAVLRKLHELAEQSSDRRPYARAAEAVVNGLAMTRAADGLHVASQSEAGKQHTVNAHGCTCKARTFCLHDALYVAVLELDAEV